MNIRYLSESTLTLLPATVRELSGSNQNSIIE